MIYHLDLSYELSFRICLSKSKKKKSGWAIIFPDNVSILIDPTSELLKFCQKDKIIQIDSSNLAEQPPNSQIGKINLRIGSYLQNYYIFLNGKILFPGQVPQCHWSKLMKTLKAKLLLAKDGNIYNPTEVNLINLVC